jgi:plastocyanin
MRIRYVLSCAALAVVVSCGGSGSDGSGTTGPPQTLASIAVTPTTVSLAAGGVQTISVTGTGTDGKVIQNLSGVRYTSQNALVADVVALGDVAGLAPGSTTIDISVTVGGVTKSATVAVTVAAGTLPSSAAVGAVDISNTFFPRTVVVQRAGTVQWTFTAVEHNVSFGAAAGAPAAIGLVKNTNVSRTFNTAGNFQYDCTIHAGMTGFVVVR